MELKNTWNFRSCKGLRKLFLGQLFSKYSFASDIGSWDRSHETAIVEAMLFIYTVLCIWHLPKNKASQHLIKWVSLSLFHQWGDKDRRIDASILAVSVRILPQISYLKNKSRGPQLENLSGLKNRMKFLL